MLASTSIFLLISHEFYDILPFLLELLSTIDFYSQINLNCLAAKIKKQSLNSTSIAIMAACHTPGTYMVGIFVLTLMYTFL